jgi:protein tyrosine phosphatase (PTP) superfamily phosphohydrolase (DUF442 family)
MSSPVSVAPERSEVPVPNSPTAVVTPPWRRWSAILVVACLAIVVAVNIVTYGGAALARVVVSDPRSRPPVLSIENLRRVDDRLWAGDQPTPGGYRQLIQEQGVKLVVNLRTGQGPDPLGDDPAYLRSLGAEFVRIPVHDGHAPDRATVERFFQVVQSSPGLVYVHCGGGVGRSSMMEAVYRSRRGEEPRLADQLFLGPLSLEQAWFVAAAEGGRTGRVPWAVQALSRVVDFPRPYFSWLVRELG